MFVADQYVRLVAEHNHRRESSATSYLGPKIIERANLHVLLNHRLLPAYKISSSNVHFDAVEFVELVDGMSFLVFVRLLIQAV